MVKLTPWKRKESRPARYNPLADEFDRFFDEPFLTTFDPFNQSRWWPRVDVSEGRKHITVEAEIPGMEKKDIDLSLEGRYLHIKGEKSRNNEDTRDGFYRAERAYGFFSRTIELPAEVDANSIDARYRRGVLKIKLKKSKQNGGKTINISGSN